ncbi:long-chain-fatty-acid--CoA ligase [Streptomyces brasiliensis]|uniref:Long-chain-fatty-acid--CoA ligase n=1 Tax=Streptomyces brasiliensis TaxID=1954 RepID=A0A917UL92_9ACTN|nr:long-chain-fatty-acid--CoA ligase [Streptomyces brasiliensis]GGJ65580.1 long-chain-fatty-acid--CoA ligase [Streptomyces brasiliensis]
MANIPFPGLMNERPLLLSEFVERAERFFPNQEVISFRGHERTVRTMGETVERVRRLASSLQRLGVGIGDRVATFSWNTQEHLELYLAVPAMGAVLHPINIRVHSEEIRFIVEHAGDKVAFIDGSLNDRFPELDSLACEVVIGSGGRAGALDYERLIAEGDPNFEFPVIPENSAAGMCYTSGTTGTPKGVVYSHRSTVLHTLLQSLPDFYAIAERDTVLPIVPMFHANAWGLPYACFMTGARLVLPGENSSPERLAQIIADERVTFAAAVPTIWHGIAYLDDIPDLSSLRDVIAGGAPISEALMRRFDEVGLPAVIGFGMTECNPLIGVGRPPARLAPDSPEWMSARLAQGRPFPLIGIRTDESVGGEMMLTGNTIASAYYDAPEQNQDRFTEDGWMRTGDIITMDEDGVIRLVDRTKDLVKSGGEWISSVELENAIVAHPDVREATVVAVPNAQWGERPYAFVTRVEGSTLSGPELSAFLEESVPRWWLPDHIEFVPEIAKTSIGKLDKKAMRLKAAVLARSVVG